MKLRFKLLLVLLVVIFIACDSADLKNALTALWKVQRLDGNEFMTNQEIVNSRDEIIISGYQEKEDSITLKNGTLSKIDKDGLTKWEITTDFSCQGIAIDAENTIFTAGRIAEEDVEKRNKLARVSDTGDILWESVNSGEFFYIKGILLDHSGNIIEYGTNQYSWNLAKYDATGNLLWQTSYTMQKSTGDVYNRMRKVLVDEADNIYIAGNYLADFKAIKYNGADGEIIYDTLYDGPYDDADGYSKDQLIDAVVDKNNNLYLAGTVILSQVDGIAINEKMVVLKYNDTGDVEWTNEYEHSAYSRGRIIAVGELAVDHDNNIIVTGSVTTTGLINRFYCFAFKYDDAGTELWFTKDTSNVVDERLRSLKIAPDNSIYGFGSNTIYHFDKNGKFIWRHETEIYGGGRNTLHIDGNRDVYWMHGPWGYSVTKFRKK